MKKEPDDDDFKKLTLLVRTDNSKKAIGKTTTRHHRISNSIASDLNSYSSIALNKKEYPTNEGTCI